MSKDDATWLNICYVVFAGIVAYICLKALSTVGIQFGWSDRYDAWYPLASNIVSILLGLGAAIWLWSSKERREYHLAAIGEVRKVNWPSFPDTKRMTMIVVVVVAVFAVILGLFDVAWSRVLQIILP